MQSSTVLAIGCFVTSLIQAWGTILQILDRRKAKVGEEGHMPLSKRSNIFLSFLLAIGAVISLGVGIWLIVRPPIPIEKTVTVEKSVPCPPSKSGTAISRGANSPANSGSNNTTTIEVPAQTPKSHQ